MPHTNAWNEASPAGTDLASQIDDFMRQMKLDVRERMALEHVWNVDTTSDGKHTSVTLAPGNSAPALSMRTAPTYSTDVKLVDLAATWSNVATTFTAVKVNITDTNSAAGSKLFDFQLGGVSMLNQSKAGVLTVNGSIVGVALTASGAAALSTTLDVGTNSLFGSGTWPTVAIARAGSRVGMFSSTEQGQLLVGDMRTGVGVDRGGDIYLGARGTTATDDFAYLILRGARDSAVSGTKSTYFSVRLNNAAGSEIERLKVTSTGGVFEQGRSIAMGATQSVAFSAGNFTTSSGTWTVGSSDQISYTYRVVGDTMFLNVVVELSTTTGTPQFLRVAIPGGFTAQEDAYVRVPYAQDSGGNISDAVAAVNSGGGTFVRIFKASGSNWANSTDSLQVQFNMHFKVA